jgi:hypothetical protein
MAPTILTIYFGVCVSMWVSLFNLVQLIIGIKWKLGERKCVCELYEFAVIIITLSSAWGKCETMVCVKYNKIYIFVEVEIDMGGGGDNDRNE